jgi:hypothetical protein
VKLLHIVNGDATREPLERSGVPGTFISWSDVLHDGPTPAGLSVPEWRRVRAEHLTSMLAGAGDVDVAVQYGREDESLESWREYDEIVFWVEHDLYDQLLLVRHLDWVAGMEDRGSARFSLVAHDTYLGLLQPGDFPALFTGRRPVTEEQLRLGTRTWEAFRDPDPTGLQEFARTPSTELPFLAGAIRRHLEDFPSASNGLARSEAQILRALVAGPAAPDATFGAASRMEERIFMGDSVFWSIVRRLASAPHPPIVLDVQPRPGRLPTGTIALTTIGQELLAGETDHVALNGIDRWMGGAHLTPAQYWRWNGEQLNRAP